MAKFVDFYFSLLLAIEMCIRLWSLVVISTVITSRSYMSQGSFYMDNLSKRQIPMPMPGRDDLCPPDGVIFVANPDDCNKYHVCNNGKTENATCAEGLYFSPESSNCDPRGNCVMCDKTDTDISYHAVQNSYCKKFAICSNGTKFDFECAEGAVFSTDNYKCVKKGNFNCPDPEPTTTAPPKSD